MSAPNAGRQSPEPKEQSEAQKGSTTDNANNQGADVEGGAEKASDKAKEGLSSNPIHPLEDAAKEKTSKK
jgi:hypothetical protein